MTTGKIRKIKLPQLRVTPGYLRSNKIKRTIQNCESAKMPKWRKEHLEKALQDIRSSYGKSSIRSTAHEYEIPATTPTTTSGRQAQQLVLLICTIEFCFRPFCTLEFCL